MVFYLRNSNAFDNDFVFFIRGVWLKEVLAEEPKGVYPQNDGSLALKLISAPAVIWAITVVENYIQI